MVFDEPQDCTDDVCDLDDSFVDGNPADGPDADQILEQIRTVWGGYTVATGGNPDTPGPHGCFDPAFAVHVP